MYLWILEAGFENGGNWPWTSRSFDHFIFNSAFNISLVYWFSLAKGCYMSQHALVENVGNIWLHLWRLEIDKWCHPILYNGCNYSSMLGLKLSHISKNGPWFELTWWSISVVLNLFDETVIYVLSICKNWNRKEVEILVHGRHDVRLVCIYLGFWALIQYKDAILPL